jgi:two-component system, OmpR family, heavy metal sensor histidine kinase CusS
VNPTIRARLTLLYLVVLAASFVAFFWICDFGFRRGIETTVNDASRNNLEIVQRVLTISTSKEMPKVQKELKDLSELWANGAIFQVAEPGGGSYIFRSPRFLLPQSPLPAPSGEGVSFLTTNLDRQQYRIAQKSALIDGRVFPISAAVPTEPFDQALDRFRVIEKRFLPLLVVLASLLGYWLSGRALAPVNRIIQSAEQIGLQNLSQRLEMPKAVDELHRLTVTLNAMLERIESSVDRIRQFTANASHDLRTPLSLIRTHAELALRRTRSEVEYRESLSRILSVSEETTQLIEALLTLARADAGAAHLLFTELDLTPVLQKVGHRVSLLAHSKGLSFSSHLPNEPLCLSGDSAALECLLFAVLENALKYTPTGGFIWLRAFANSGEIVVEVKDSGVGVAAEDLPRIFDRFFRADQVRSREVPGSGLGLSIARWIAETHKGRIEAESQLGAGSLFRIVLAQLPVLPSVPGATRELIDSQAALS